MIGLDIVEEDDVEIAGVRAIADKEARNDASLGKTVMGALVVEGKMAPELSSGGALLDSLFMVVLVGVATGDGDNETDISIFQPITAIALTVELVANVVVAIVQTLEFSGAVNAKVSTILGDTLDRQSPSGTGLSRK